MSHFYYTNYYEYICYITKMLTLNCLILKEIYPSYIPLHKSLGEVYYPGAFLFYWLPCSTANSFQQFFVDSNVKIDVQAQQLNINS